MAEMARIRDRTTDILGNVCTVPTARGLMHDRYDQRIYALLRIVFSDMSIAHEIVTVGYMEFAVLVILHFQDLPRCMDQNPPQPCMASPPMLQV